MGYRFAPMSEDEASAIVGWRYQAPYSVYNASPDAIEGLLDPVNAYHSVTSEQGELIGFCCFGPDARVPGGDYGGVELGTLDVGLGLDFVGAVVEFARGALAPTIFRLTVATFNRRAIRVYERAGFQESSRFRSTQDSRQFVQMVRRA